MTSTLSDTAARRLRLSAYVILTIAMLFAILDLMVSIQPISFGAMTWRYGAAGLAANAAITPTFMLLLFAAAAAWFGDRGALIGVAIVAGIVSLLAVLTLGSFMLDAIQMRRQIRPEVAARFDIATAQGGAKLLLSAIASGMLAVAAVRAAKALRSATSGRSSRGEPSSVLISRPGTTATRSDTAPVAAPPASTRMDRPQS